MLHLRRHQTQPNRKPASARNSTAATTITTPCGIEGNAAELGKRPSNIPSSLNYLLNSDRRRLAFLKSSREAELGWDREKLGLVNY